MVCWLWAEGLSTPKLDKHHLGPFKGVEKHICHMFPSDISHGETFIWILDVPTFPYHQYPSHLNLTDLRVWLGKDPCSFLSNKVRRC